MSTLRDLILGKIRDHRGFLAFVFILFSVRWSFADQYRVPTGSMEPTIQIGDHIFVDKMAYDLRLPFTDWVLHTFAEPERGDVITFDYPLDPSQTYVKRLIGLPGDHIEIVDGFIEVNGSLTVASRGELAALWAELQRARPLLHRARGALFFHGGQPR